MVERTRSEITDGMRIDWDVGIRMDDGVIVRADVFRPISEGKYAALLFYVPTRKVCTSKTAIRTSIRQRSARFMPCSIAMAWSSAEPDDATGLRAPLSLARPSAMNCGVPITRASSCLPIGDIAIHGPSPTSPATRSLPPRKPTLSRCLRPYSRNLACRGPSAPTAAFPLLVQCLFGLSRLSVWWLRLGIEIERIKPGHPQQNGNHERMHLTFKLKATKPAAKTSCSSRPGSTTSSIAMTMSGRTRPSKCSAQHNATSPRHGRTAACQTSTRRFERVTSTLRRGRSISGGSAAHPNALRLAMEGHG
ncbi:hypothetical protein ABIB82_006913 [Bradyrhizobium sp. i1.8.4]